MKFYAEAIPKNQDQVEIDSINEQYLAEFLEALQTSINQMSADGVRISFVASKGRELGRYMAETLDEEWNRLRGMEIQSVGIASISYDEESQKLINMRNQGAMLGDRRCARDMYRARWHAALRQPVPTEAVRWQASWEWAPA